LTRFYHVLPAADRDLDDQADYLAREASLDIAVRFYHAAATTFSHITDMPGIGERWPSTNPRLADMRVWRIEGFENHLIFYRATVDGVTIIRVLHGARDIESLLEAEQPS
jgi:toxin ParE1/3/4